MLNSVISATLLAASTPAINYTPVNLQNKTIVSTQHDAQIRCLARNIYFEAGNQPRSGKVAVAQVVVNRTKNPKFPNSACSVINQRSGRVCQFSWVCKNPKIRDMNLYRSSLEIATDVYFNKLKDNTFGALFFHANYVRPSWSNVFRHTITIGDHKFYKF